MGPEKISGFMSPMSFISKVSSTLATHLPRFYSRKGQSRFGPARTLQLLVGMCANGQVGYRRHLSQLGADALRHLGWTWANRPSASAFCQSRRKLTLEHCHHGLQAVYQSCNSARIFPEFHYKGRRLYALDGSGLTLPISEALLHEFGAPSSKHGGSGCPSAHLMMLWDLSAHQPVQYHLAPYKHSERKQALSILSALPADALLVTDRGFFSYHFLGYVLEHGCDFIMRVQKHSGKALKAFIDSSQTDTIVSIGCPPKLCRIGAPESEPIYRIRAIKVALKNGETEVLVTNLKRHDGHTLKRLAALYTTRWRIETAFNEMKSWHSFQQFSSKSVLGIHQEITAAFIFQLMVSEMEVMARTENREAMREHRKGYPLPTMRFNRRILADAVEMLLHMDPKKTREITERIQMTLQAAWRYRNRRKPDRNYPRRRIRPALGYRG